MELSDSFIIAFKACPYEATESGCTALHLAFNSMNKDPMELLALMTLTADKDWL